MKGSILKNRGYAVLSTVAVIALWGVIAAWVNHSIKVPSPLETLEALVGILSGPHFYIEILNTLRRVFLGFGVAFVSGVSLGIVAGLVPPVYYLLRPVVLAQRAMPTMGVILLALIWLNREVAPILVGVLVIFPLIYSAVVTGIQSVDPKLVEMATVYRLSRRKRLKHLYIPSIRTALASVASATIGLNVKVTIAAEVLSQPQYAIGTGFQMEKVALNTAGVIAWSIVAILIAGCLQWMIGRLITLRRRVVH